MSHFQPKPIQTLLEFGRTMSAPLGLPSRGPSPQSMLPSMPMPLVPSDFASGMISQATAILSSAHAGHYASRTQAPSAVSSQKIAQSTTVEPACVISASPVAPGGTAHATISLTNDDERAARLVFVSAGLVGDDGVHVPHQHLSFQPQDLTLGANETGEVVVRVKIPTSTPDGVYSGLVRASHHPHVHAVLVVQVITP